MHLIPRRIRLPRLAATLLAFITFVTVAPLDASAKGCAAERFIVGAGQAYDRAARAGSAAAFSSAVSRYSDMHALAMFSLGRYRKNLPQSNSGEYVSLTRIFMGRFMLQHSKGLNAGKLTVVDCSGPASNMLVRARTSGGSQINFRIYRARGGYLVRDMNIQGIWLVQRMRSTFVGTLQRTNGSFPELFRFLKNY